MDEEDEAFAIGFDFGEHDNDSAPGVLRVSNAYHRILKKEQGGESMTAQAMEWVVALLPPLIWLNTHEDNFNQNMYLRSLEVVLRRSRRHLIEFEGPADSELRGSPSDFNGFLLSLGQLSALQTFKWNAGIYYDYDGDDPEEEEDEDFLEIHRHTINIDDVFKAVIGSKSPLMNLAIQFCDCPSAPILRNMLRAKISTLQSLEILTGWEKDQVQVLAEYLAGEGCQLKKLVLCLWLKLEKTKNGLAKELVGVLGNSPSLREFEIQSYVESCVFEESSPILIDFYVSAAHTLLKSNHNTSLHCFHNSFGNVIQATTLPTIAKAFLETLKVNTNLTDIRFLYDRENVAIPEEMDLLERYLELNRLGRKDVLEKSHTMTRKDLVNAMVKDTNNLDWLGFVLRTNPAICQLPSPVQCTNKKRKRHLG